MSAELCQQLDDGFAIGADVNNFFSVKQLNDIRYQWEPRERPPIGNPGESCTTNLFFGFFFDGTKNNYVQAESGKNHSNVARLYDCYPGLSVPGVLPRSTDWQYHPDSYTHFFKVYVPGVASPFRQVNDRGEGLDGTAGAAAGALGERRIIWALVQAINNIHRYFLKSPLVSQSELEGLLKRVVLNKYARGLMDGRPEGDIHIPNKELNSIPAKEFAKILLKLHSAVSGHWPNEKTGRPAKIDPGIVKTIYISIFGFSRGATEARAFANWLQSLCKLDSQLRGKPGAMSLGGFNVQFDFMGLFDTVASVGLANSSSLFHGHAAWADTEDSLRIPLGIKCLHLVAAHELRRSFPVDSISVNGVIPDGSREVVVPGVHSDIGCGYCPGEQGRGIDPNGDDMLSRIPLLMMYKEARLNGVPLKLELAGEAAKAKFALKAETIAAFNAYISVCQETQGPLQRIMHEQARKQIEWRLYRRVNGKSPVQHSTNFSRASIFDQNDLYSAACEFEEEIAEFLKWVKEKGKVSQPATPASDFDSDRTADWEEMATWWEKVSTPGPEVLRFFDNYVHDSRAWFKMIPSNPDNEKDMLVKLKNWVQIRNLNSPLPVVVGKADYKFSADRLTEDERRAADEYARTGKIPRMITSGREPFRMGAGYLRFRKIYSGMDSDFFSSALKRTGDTTARAVRDVGDAAAHGANQAADKLKNDAHTFVDEGVNWIRKQMVGDRGSGY